MSGNDYEVVHNMRNFFFAVTLNSLLCPIMLMGFPSLSSVEGVGEFGNSPQWGGQSYLGAHEWNPQVKRC